MSDDQVSGGLADTEANKKTWIPLSRSQRRVVGVLVEKSKTTPAAYPMTLNSIRTACNQKSNRDPQMDIREEDVENTLYLPEELERLKSGFEGGVPDPQEVSVSSPTATPSLTTHAADNQRADQMEQQINQLQQAIADIQSRLESLEDQ